MKEILSALGVSALFVGITAIFVLNSAYPLSVLWGWFISPLGAPEITTLHAVGIMCVGAILKGAKPRKSDNEEVGRSEVAVVLISPWFALLIGWIVV